MEQLTKEQALAFAEKELYKDMTDRQRAEFQMEQEKLCMPFEVFHASLEKALGRGVYTHEFGLNWDGLKKELYGEKPAPTMEEILALIPKDKQVYIIETPKNYPSNP